MSPNEQEIVFTKSNHQLLNLAKIADIFFWISIIVLPIICFGVVLQRMSYYDNMHVLLCSTTANFWENLIQSPTQGFKFLGDMLQTLVITTVFILGFKGISLGLRMIVETEVNYRLSRGE